MTNTANKPLDWYAERTAYLSEFMSEERRQVLQRTLNSRTRYMTILTENTYHAQNASALVRHCEAFGVQDIHTIETRCKFNPNVNIVRGTDKWIDLHRHRTTAEAIADLKGRGYRIVATTPHREDKTPETFDVAASPSCWSSAPSTPASRTRSSLRPTNFSVSRCAAWSRASMYRLRRPF